MKCQARILDKEYPFEGVSPPFHTTKECGNPVKKRICDSNDDRYSCCSECFRRYNTNVEWYGWFDGLYPPEARVVGSQAFYQCKAKLNTIVAAPKQKTIDEKVPKSDPVTEVLAEKLTLALAEPVKAVSAVKVIDTLAQEFSALTIKLPTASDAKPKKPKLSHPIESDLSGHSSEELRALHAALVAWMNGEASRYPRILVPYFKYRTRIEALLINKK